MSNIRKLYKMHLNKGSHKRLAMIIVLLTMISAGIVMSLYFASDNIVFFIKPSELTQSHIGKKIRVGGLVAQNSIKKIGDRTIIFNITDDIKEIVVRYRGILPTLFREGQGIVAEGFITQMDSQFIAEKLLTKHDENYKPPETKIRN